MGTTGASMLLIRPLLRTNAQRKHVVHTVVFFIFLVSNVGGCLLPIGDPPLFLGYLRGVAFFWTLNLWTQWVFCCLILLAVYYAFDTYFYKKEDAQGSVGRRDRERAASLEGLGQFPVARRDRGCAWRRSATSANSSSTGWTPFPFLRELLHAAPGGAFSL